MDHMSKKMKMAKFLTEPFMTNRSRREKLEEALERYQLQNALLLQLLEKHNIEIPDAIVNYAEIDLLGKEAKIYADLESIQRRLDSLMTMLLHIDFNCLSDRSDLPDPDLPDPEDEE